MKTLLLFLALAVSCCGQTLKWEATFDAPSFSYDQAFGVPRADASGWSAICIEYSDFNFAPLGVQFAWYSNTGKRIYSEIDPSFKNGSLIQFSSVCAVVEYTAFDDSKVIRKYTRRGGIISKADTPMGKSDFVSNTDGATTPDRIGFFVVTRSANERQILGMKRYSFR
jgi:hypothetical protein